MAGAERRPRRCAVYTRKSSEEGLEQDFNSLDAQREACEAGRIAHKGNTYEGQHPPIIDRETWHAVQTALAAHTRERPFRAGASAPSLLRAKLFDEAGEPLTSSHTVKSGRRYRYYVSRDRAAGSAQGSDSVRSDRWRLPAREIERFVEEAVHRAAC